MTYKCVHFTLPELVPKHVHAELGEKAWWLLDNRALITLDKLRDSFGKITINDWLWGGPNQWRGLRTPQSPYYKLGSQHSYGRAFDCIFGEDGVTAKIVRKYILKHPDEFPYIRAIEDSVSWLHFDVRNVEPIMVFRP